MRDMTPSRYPSYLVDYCHNIAYNPGPAIICQPASNLISRRVPATILSGFLLRERLYSSATGIVTAIALFRSVT